MRNVELKLNGSDDSKIVFWCASTNDGDKHIKECAITVLKESMQLDFDLLDIEELNELIDYLINMRNHINDFNNK